MPEPSDELLRQIEAAYDYRGHVTLRLLGGETIEGFVYNREGRNPRAREDRFIDVMVKDSDLRRRIRFSELASIALTGEDFAAGKSYEDYLKKKQQGLAP